MYFSEKWIVQAKKGKNWGSGWRETAKKGNRLNLQAEFNRAHKILYQTNNKASLFSGVAQHFPQSPSPQKNHSRVYLEK